MKAKDNDGPAFPVDADYQLFQPKDTAEAKRLFSGMTLRDYFAAKAMQGMIANDWPMHGLGSVAHLAVSAYGMADAMLLERAK
jgi:hypothetical protein